jgi:sugar phosphate isomerase/epimerase
MRKSDFDRVVRNIKSLQAMKAERGLNRPDLYINFVSQHANVEDMSKIVELAHELGIHTVHVIHLIDGFLPDRSGNLLNFPDLLGPAVVETKARALELGVNCYIAPVYGEVVSAYEAQLRASVPV